MDREVTWGTRSPRIQAEFMEDQAFTAAYSGHFGKSRDLIKRAIALAVPSKDQELIATFETSGAYIEALSGNMTEAKQQASRALKWSNGQYVQKSVLAPAKK
jgi:hypothetical protein